MIFKNVIKRKDSSDMFHEKSFPIWSLRYYLVYSRNLSARVNRERIREIRFQLVFGKFLFMPPALLRSFSVIYWVNELSK